VSASSDREAVRARFADFLLAEREHAAESLLRNEESGERRATFFVSIAGAAAAVLAFAFGGETSIVPRERVPAAAAGSAALLLILGLLTVRRLIERHVVTDRYIFALRSLRRAFLTREDAQAFPNAFFKLYDQFEPRKVSMFSLGKGGWLETIALINAVLAGLAAATAVPAWLWVWAALAAFATTWSGQILYARQKLAQNVAELMACEARERDK
jgi:hypothetical protein